MNTDGHRLLRVFLTAAAMMIVQAAHSGGQATSGGGGEPPEYEVEVIPGPWCGIFGYEPAFGTGINDLGNVCGYNFDCNNDDEPFFWSPETGRVALELLGGFDEGRAYDLDSSDQVVGWMTKNNKHHATLWDGKQIIELGTGPGGNYSEAFAINANGLIAGTWGNNITNDPGLAAFIWQDGVMMSLDLPMGPNGFAWDMNDQSQITGWMGDAFFIDSHAFIWDNGEVTDLGVIPGGFTAEGMAINNDGDVAVQGRMFNDNDEVIVRSFLWRDGEWIDLGVLAGFDETFATDVDDAGQVIGRCDMLENTTSRPFLWQDGTMWDLNELWVSDDQELIGIGLPWAINSSGQITIQGAHQEFGSVAVRLTQILPPLGDLDGDGTVGASDLLILLANWGPCADCRDCVADLNGDCAVGAADVLILLANWG